MIKKYAVLALKQIDLGSAVAVRLTKLTGKSKVPIHPKHFLEDMPWFTNFIEFQDKVLDLGSGNGQNAIKVASIAKQVVGAEIDDDLIKIAKKSLNYKNVSKITFVKANLENQLPFKDESFNKIIFLDVLEHLVRRDQILKECRRILKRGGLIMIGVPNSQTSWKKFQRSASVCSFSDPDHKIEFSESSISKLLAKHGYKIIHFGYGKYDTPIRGAIDIIGGFSISIYKRISELRAIAVQTKHEEASGFEIVAKK